MKNIKTIVIIIIGCSIILFIYGLATAFDPVYDKAEITQNIGGTLICNAEFIPSIHSSPNRISYLYKYNGKIIDLGSGAYTRREWKKDEQLIKFNNIKILKTGGGIGYDKILIINEITNKVSEYEFTPENIESEDLWKKTKANSLINYCCSEAFVDKIEKAQIKIHYKYRISENLPDKYEIKYIYYDIDTKTGIPNMIKVE
jgi:hypothetical protein